MSVPLPATTFDEIATDIGVFLVRGGHYVDVSDPSWRDLYTRCEKLQQANVVEASELKSQLFQIGGDLEQALYWASNIVKNGAKGHGMTTTANALSNLGWVSKAAEMLPEVLTVEEGQITRRMTLLLSVAAFSLGNKACASLRRAGGVPEQELEALCEAAESALHASSIGEEKVRQMLDKAGAILRRERLLWLNERPDIRTDGASLLFMYRVDTSPAKAAELTWELAEALAADDLVDAAVSVGFLGEAEAARLAA